MNTRILAITGLGILLLMLLVSGCTRRDNPAVPSDPPAGDVSQGTHEYYGLDQDSARWSQFPSRWIDIYRPPGYDNQPNGFRFPVLYLLPGYDGEPSFFYRFGNENYYRTSAIAAIADELIANGEIKPFFIVMPDASIFYGGSFYNNNDLAGKWENMMSYELVDYADDITFSPIRTIASKESRAIGGHSSGGYGAVRIAMKYPNLFNSVSAIDAPLAFAQGDMAGLFQRYLDESGITTEAEYFDTDTSGFRTNNQRYKMLFYSMAASFSSAPYTNVTKFGRLQINLPFDYQGNLVQSVWDQWMANDLYSWLDNATYRANLTGQNLHFETSNQDLNNFNLQTSAFVEKLHTLNIEHEDESFSGYPGGDSRSRTFLYDRIAGILKFHDRYLKDRDGNF
jgi:S-formylglutathione hydrolase FrmB